MIRYAARRLAVTAPILLLISLATFWAAGKISSPVAQIAVNPRISAEARRAYAESLGLNDPFGVRYLRWLGNLATGDFGTSLVRNGQDVWPFVERAMGQHVAAGVCGGGAVAGCGSRHRHAVGGPPRLADRSRGHRRVVSGDIDPGVLAGADAAAVLRPASRQLAGSWSAAAAHCRHLLAGAAGLRPCRPGPATWCCR